jgi:hypothetical protein
VPGEQLELRRRVFGGAVPDQLDLVELVQALDAARVLARGAGLAAEARRVRDEPARQVGASSTSSRYRFVTGTSAVGMRNRSSPRTAYASSSNFGSCPVPVIVARVTSAGAHTSS